MTKKELNSRQARGMQIFEIYNFENFHRSNNKNSTNDFPRQFDYKKISLLKIILLSTLEIKLTLSSSEELLT